MKWNEWVLAGLPTFNYISVWEPSLFHCLQKYFLKSRQSNKMHNKWRLQDKYFLVIHFQDFWLNNPDIEKYCASILVALLIPVPTLIIQMLPPQIPPQCVVWYWIYGSEMIYLPVLLFFYLCWFYFENHNKHCTYYLLLFIFKLSLLSS